MSFTCSNKEQASLTELGTLHIQYIVGVQINSESEDVEKEKHYSSAGGIANWYNHSGTQSEGSSENRK